VRNTFPHRPALGTDACTSGAMAKDDDWGSHAYSGLSSIDPSGGIRNWTPLNLLRE